MELRPMTKDRDVSVESVSSDEKRYVAQAYSPNAASTDAASLRRLFSFLQLLAFSLTFMESWEVAAMNMGAAFLNGGPSTLVWGTIVVIVGALAQALSMAELAAIQPIAGAQCMFMTINWPSVWRLTYRDHWTHFLAPQNHRRFITWMQGWVTWFAWVSALAGSTSSESNILLGLVATNYPGYVFHPWHVTLLIIAMLILVGLMNMYTFKAIPWLELIAGVGHVLLFIIFVVVLVTLAPRSSADFVFTERYSSSGWNNSFVSWNLGLLVPAWGFIGFDGVVHMSEEVRQAKQAVPRAMIWTIIINGVMAFAMVLVLLFTMGNPDEVLKSPYPIIPICFNVAGQKAGTAMVVGLLVITFCVVAASLASVSRITWAWARDGALPSWFAKVDPKHRVPIRSLWLPILIVALLSLLNVGSTAATAFSAFTALSSLGLYSSYIIAISCILHARITGRLGENSSHSVQYGEWKLPRGLGTPINIFALLWTIYITIWLPFPTMLPVTGTNMNYAGPVYVFVVTAALMWWFAWGKTKWPGLNALAIERVEREQ